MPCTPLMLILLTERHPSMLWLVERMEDREVTKSIHRTNVSIKRDRSQRTDQIGDVLKKRYLSMRMQEFMYVNETNKMSVKTVVSENQFSQPTLLGNRCIYLFLLLWFVILCTFSFENIIEFTSYFPIAN